MLLHRLLHSMQSMGHSMLVAQAFTLSAEYGSLNAHCTGFYTQCGAWVAQCSLHRFLHSMRSMAKMGLSTIVQRLLHSVHVFFQKLPHARTSALKAGCSKWRKGCKPIEEIDIDLYAVKKITCPRLAAYSGWGILKLHDGFAWGPKHQIFWGHSTDCLLIQTNGHMVISIFHTPLVTSQVVCLEMSLILHYFKYHNDEILMGKLWMELHPSFKELLFYTEIPRMDKMSRPLQIALGEGSWDARYRSMLVVRMLTIYFQYAANFQQKLSKGLDEVHPFSNTAEIDVIYCEAEEILSQKFVAVGVKNTSRIWGFMSRFVMLDRCSKTMGVAKLHPGHCVPRKLCKLDYLGTGSKVGTFLKEKSSTLLSWLAVSWWS